MGLSCERTDGTFELTLAGRRRHNAEVLKPGDMTKVRQFS